MHLPIRVVGRSQPVEVPFQLQPSFKFAVHIPGHGVQEFVAELSNRHPMKARVLSIDAEPRRFVFSASERISAGKAAESILSAVLRRLGLVEVDGERIPSLVPDALLWVAIAHDKEEETAKACNLALADLTPVWRDRTEPAPKVGVAADILDSYYQQVQDEVIGEWERKAEAEHLAYLTAQQAGGHSEVAP